MRFRANTGTVNQTYTCTVHTNPPDQTLAIGNGTMSLEVKDGSGAVVATLRNRLGLCTRQTSHRGGVFITLETNGISPGYLNDGDVITIEALGQLGYIGLSGGGGHQLLFQRM